MTSLPSNIYSWKFYPKCCGPKLHSMFLFRTVCMKNICQNVLFLNDEQKLTWSMLSEDKYVISVVAKLLNTLFEGRNTFLKLNGVVPFAS